MPHVLNGFIQDRDIFTLIAGGKNQCAFILPFSKSNASLRVFFFFLLKRKCQGNKMGLLGECRLKPFKIGLESGEHAFQSVK